MGRNIYAFSRKPAKFFGQALHHAPGQVPSHTRVRAPVRVRGGRTPLDDAAESPATRRCVLAAPARPLLFVPPSGVRPTTRSASSPPARPADYMATGMGVNQAWPPSPARHPISCFPPNPDVGLGRLGGPAGRGCRGHVVRTDPAGQGTEWVRSRSRVQAPVFLCVCWGVGASRHSHTLTHAH